MWQKQYVVHKAWKHLLSGPLPKKFANPYSKVKSYL